ncbi:hypothetical protein C1645_829700 [Glomus cerebriforme]|uniref:BTB/POZ domain-containing protein n=1 Tax=Glomus cerebriforme TaxID=658196 RepID=A0A397STY6_9GLOM|nr:hypothetical protein C1645_829700 [Glomus cerebriforme]
MASIFHSGLSKDFSQILTKEFDDYNVIIQVGENQNTQEFHVHSVVLRARSPYFEKAFSSDWITKKNGIITFSKPNITPIVFDMILRYIYASELDLTKHTGENILKLLIASDELLIEELFEHVQDYLIEKRSTWVQENFVLILHTISKFTSCKKLQNYCLGSICKDPQTFVTSEAFPSLDKNILTIILNRNDFQLEEIIVWDSLIKWGIKQTPELENKNIQDEWTNKDYRDLKNNLSDFIPLIKFLEINSEDFYRKVRPYKDIIPKHIYDEVIKYYLVDQPKLFRFIESKIIKPELTNIICNWIDKKDPMLIRTEKKDPQYKFNLIYRGSRDSLDANSFKKKCQGQIASLVLIKIQQSNKIFGGYSSIGFNSIGDELLFKDNDHHYYCSSNNFIFSFENSEDTQNMKISRVKNHSRALLKWDTGFNFGWSALYTYGQKLVVGHTHGYYEDNLQIDAIYDVEEIETFIVTNY